jgi:mannose-6-phosphate isomerase-like protein (cupin superfamily)
MIRRRAKWASVVAMAMLGLGSAVWAQGGTAAAKNSVDEISATPTSPVHYYSKQQVDASFEKTGGGDLLYDGDGGSRNFTLMTSVREASGNVEVHMHVTDVIYIVKGSATIVTGGKLSDVIEGAKSPNGKAFPKDEIRGHNIIGGESHHLAAGDVIIIPNGVPHLFSDFEGPFWYHLVKIRQP